MSNFYKWQKISDRTSDYNLDKKDNKIFSPKTKWFGTEKIHGANFSIYLINDKIKFAKRNGFLDDNEWFYNYQLIKNKLIKGVKQLSTQLVNPNIIVYGELFGGFYPSDTKTFSIKQRINDKGVCIVPFENRAIQEGIYYSPNIEYMVFDIALILPNNTIKFVSYEKVIELVEKTELIVAKPLIIDTFDRVSNYNINFNSTIPEQLGLEPMLPNSNIAEGIVIRPLENHILSNSTRCLIKIKNKKFLEVSDNFDLTEASKSYQYILSNLITQNRFQSVISKIGKLTLTNKEEVLKEFVEDVWNDYYLHYSHIQISDIDDANIFVKKYSESLLQDQKID